MKTIRILNLGAGVQSTTLALMAECGEIEKYDYAIFADVQAEPKNVYDHLEWLVGKLSYPVLIRSRGSLLENLKTGVEGDSHRFVSIPVFTGDPGKLKGLVRRQCTTEYKINVVENAIRRDVLSLPKYGRIPHDVSIVQSFGLSFDEPQRVAKVKNRHASKQWNTEFPLFDLEMTRSDCIKWLSDHNVPHEVPRSACTFCPYHSDKEWLRIKTEDPDSWKQAVEVDKLLRDKSMRCTKGYDDLLWLHRSCKPLEEIDFTENPKSLKGQQFFSFNLECEGMCGV